MSNLAPSLPVTGEGAPASAPVAGGRAAAGPRGRRLLTWAKARPWVLLAPALIILGGLMLWPLIRVVLFSLQDYGLREIVSGKPNCIGLDNYVEAFTNPTLWSVVLPNTLGFAVAAVAGTVIVGTLVALLLASLGTLWRTVVASAIMIAWAMPAVTGTYVWVWIFDADRGIVNSTLMAMGLMDEPYNWFTNQWTFYGIVLLNVIHHGFPFVAVSILAGLNGIADGDARGRRGGRSRRLAALLEDHLPDAQAGLRGPHHPVDHLGLQGLQPALRADGRPDSNR